MIELNYTNINKAMNISVQSVFHGGERRKKNFTEGNRRLPIFYNNGDTGATSPRPSGDRVKTGVSGGSGSSGGSGLPPRGGIAFTTRSAGTRRVRVPMLPFSKVPLGPRAIFTVCSR